MVLGLALPTVAAAQDFGVMNSAETIRRENFKVMASPIVVFGKDAADDEIGVAFVVGYGLTDWFDVEGKAAFFDGVTFIGGDAEAWLVKGQKVDVSVIGGFHVGRRDGSDTKVFDFTFLGSGHIAPKLELFGALDFARHSVDNTDATFTTAHLVPGLEYAISPQLDFVAELGLALNDRASHYVSAGLAFYIR
jgi:hypothetical protein